MTGPEEPDLHQDQLEGEELRIRHEDNVAFAGTPLTCLLYYWSSWPDPIGRNRDKEALPE